MVIELASMELQPALVLRNGIKNLGDTVADIITHYIFDKQHRDDYSHNGIDKIKIVALCNSQMRGEERADKVNQIFENKSRKTTQSTNYERENHHKGLLGYVLLTPKQEAHEAIVQPLFH